jgi:hypothetical protein
MSHPARGSMQRGRGTPSPGGDLTAQSITGAAIPVRRNSGRIPNEPGPLLHRVRRPMRSVGIDGKANRAGRRHRCRMSRKKCQEAAR